MPARNIDTAFVEFVPDFSAIERGERELERQLEGLEDAAEEAAQAVEESFEDAGDELDRMFTELKRDADLAFDRIAADAQDTGQEVEHDIARGGEGAENAFEELSRTARRELDQIDRAASATAAATAGKFKALGIAGGAAVAGLGLAATAGLGAIATMGLMSAAQLEQVQISFNALLGSVEEGERVFKELQQFAATTPFEFPEVAAAAKRFLAFNEQVGLSDDFLQEFLTITGDLASVTGAGAEGLNRITLAIGQIASKGRVSLEELMQIGEAVPGFSAIGAIAQALGVTTGEAMEMISQGAVDAQTGIAALLQGMQQFPGAAGAMEKQSQTLLGVFSTFKDTIGIALADAFEPVIPAIKESLTTITPVIGEALGEIAPALGQVLASALPLLADLLEFITPILTPILTGLAEFIDLVGEAGGGLQPLGDAIGQIFEALKPLIPVLSEVFIELIVALIPIIEELVPVIEELTPALTSTLRSLIPIIPPLSKLIVLTLQFLTALIDFSSFDGRQLWGRFTEGLSDAWDAITGFFTGVGQFFKDLPGRIIGFLRGLPRLLADAFKKAIDAAFFAIGFGLAAIYVLIKEAPGRIIAFIVNLPTLIGNIFTSVRQKVIDVTSSMIAWLMKTSIELPNKILGWLSGLPSAIGNFFKNAWDSAVQNVRTAIDRMIQWIRDFPSNLGGFSQSVAGSVVNFIKNAINSAIGSINNGIARVDDALPFVSIPRIPFLARGGVAFGPAVIGEDPSTSPEVALPLGDARAMNLLADAIRNALGGEGGGVNVGNNITIIVEIDGQQLQGRINTTMDQRDRNIVRRVTMGNQR